MKTIYNLRIVTLLFYFSISWCALFAQSPQMMSYQAVIRDANNALVINAPVGMQISILTGTAAGPAVYIETHQVSTNANGLLSMVIGEGDAVIGSIEGIDWSKGAYFLKIETDPTGGNSYTFTGVSQLLSVPYALHAEKATEASNGIESGSQSGQMLYWNGSAWIPLEPGPQNQVLTMCDGVPTWTPGGNCRGTISSVDCNNEVVIGSLIKNWPAVDVHVEVTYSGGNGGAYVAQRLISSGVLGLEAILQAGFFDQGEGILRFSIKGTPTSAGTASFAFIVAGYPCQIDLEVLDNGIALYPEGSVFCLGLPTQIVDVFSPNTGKTWMDRNLGAGRAAQSSTDQLAYGDMYQWGRFSDGHQCRWSDIKVELSSSDTAGNDRFIVMNTAPWDWRSPQEDNLWQGVNGVNNPCPKGYRIPTRTEWEAERFFWNNNDLLGSFASPLKLTFGGYREHSNGSLEVVNSRGYYWSNTVSATSALQMRIESSGVVIQFQRRGYGFSVRCIKD